MIGPFISFDHMGPVDLPRGLPRNADVLPHPRIGPSTVTYLFAGEIVHRDSVGMERNTAGRDELDDRRQWNHPF